MSDLRDGIAGQLRSRRSTLDAHEVGVDSRIMQSSSGLVRPRVIFGVATALGFFSGSQAFYYVSTFTEWPASLPFLIALNLGFWYSWACLTPAIFWLSRKAPFIDRDSWKLAAAVHIPAVFVDDVAAHGTDGCLADDHRLDGRPGTAAVAAAKRSGCSSTISTGR